MGTILVVCTGNLCRSPMAAALLQARLEQDEQREDWLVISAGTWAPDGRPASAHAIAEMMERGLDIAAHRSKNVDEAALGHADLVLVMTRNHAEALSVVFPQQTGKVYLLSSMARETYDIPDPYGGTRLEYAEVARELERLIEAGYDRIVTLAESSCST
jgi:protein-tyrosine-phosphatase